MKRIFATILGAIHAGNGAFMLFAGNTWYQNTPGVSQTGPYNPHFVADIGAAYLASGLGVCAVAWRPQYWPAALAGAGFLVLHALIHVVDSFRDAHFDPMGIIFVIIPAGLALWVALPKKTGGVP